ncbi:SRPBCC family protein [Agrococcus sp. ARC_14]|uniref:SRPBCC family protein n=1 Tax=Agrococcus sp. ARC_14 TaxID=2919927 RepID=UPI001F05E688|nr:SRPBCC family protein [Agrococcus sp. ARC_14]MCH1882023.1 SRPBCC family protein [Agrococcus sp. ARC_14]
MSDITLTLERTIDAPTDAVWRVITDLEQWETVLSGVSRIERLAGFGYAIGTRWRETRTMFGGESTEEMEVVGIDEGRSTMIASEANGLAYRTEFTLEPTGEGATTLLRMRFGGSYLSPSWVQRVLRTLTSRIGLAVMRKAMQQDLHDIAAAAQAA